MRIMLDIEDPELACFLRTSREETLQAAYEAFMNSPVPDMPGWTVRKLREALDAARAAPPPMDAQPLSEHPA